MYTALEIAKYVVYKCIKDRKLITNLQLQKILYYLRREFLKDDVDLFLDDIEAWRLGPVIPNVYYHFCGHGSLPIDIYFDEWEYLEIDKDHKEIIDRIVEDKRTRNPWDMVADTHKEGGAWSVTYDEGKGFKDVIDVNLIKKDKG